MERLAAKRAAAAASTSTEDGGAGSVLSDNGGAVQSASHTAVSLASEMQVGAADEELVSPSKRARKCRGSGPTADGEVEGHTLHSVGTSKSEGEMEEFYPEDADDMEDEGAAYVDGNDMRGHLGLKDRASSDIIMMQRVAVRECVLAYGKAVEVAEVVDYINGQSAFRVSALEVKKMLHQEIQLQIKNGIETEDDVGVVVSSSAAAPLVPAAATPKATGLDSPSASAAKSPLSSGLGPLAFHIILPACLATSTVFKCPRCPMAMWAQTPES